MIVNHHYIAIKIKGTKLEIYIKMCCTDFGVPYVVCIIPVYKLNLSFGKSMYNQAKVWFRLKAEPK